ncbi:MAG: hypothetical protein GY795_10205 [Desulfobacterales bacterium]|nr:hypothetical protein [Desulfobacterales bacterium]
MRYVTTAERIGETKMLLCQMEARFGTIPQWAKDKIQHADVAALETWGIRMFYANSVGEVLREKKEKKRYVTNAERIGETKILLLLMKTRFGSLPQWAEDKVKNADVAAIEDWSIRVLSANSLEEVLKEI